MEDTVGAFVPHGRFQIDGAADGSLTGLTFAAKDIIDVAGHVTGCGNPDWLRTHRPAVQTAPSIQRLLDAGAALVGKTVTEELATGLTGENVHYGTPINVNAPGRVAGGLSSGSAAAVAAGLVDFALGSDTGGSVRSPASFCGIYGIRPTHGRVPLDGVMPLSSSLDVVGWFTRDAELLAKVGSVLLEGTPGRCSPGRLIIADDLFAGLDAPVREALEAAVGKVEGLLGRAWRLAIADEAPITGLKGWARIARTLWGAEAWRAHGEWITSEKPTFGSGVAARFAARAKVTDDEYEAALQQRDAIAAYFGDLLAGGAILALPAGPGLPPMRGGSDADIDPFRAANEPIGAVAGLGGLPEIVLPLSNIEGVPLGLGLAAARGNDEMLFDVALALSEAGIAESKAYPEVP